MAMPQPLESKKPSTQNKNQVCVLDRQGRLDDLLSESYHCIDMDTLNECIELVESEDIKLILLDKDQLKETGGLSALIELISALDNRVPVILFGDVDDLETKVEALRQGCDDYIEYDISPSELKARLQRSIFSKIANDQLLSRISQANEMAFIAMSDTSDLGVNVQFLLDSINCENLDQLGMRLFHALKNYGLHCSLQMRSKFGLKNMEEHGMAKDLESQLLFELKDSGRHIEFGKRLAMNYGQVSLLIRNMPLEDEKKCGAIRDNVVSLLQGVDARIKALDDRQALKLEKEVIQKMSFKVQDVMKSMEGGYQEVMRSIAKIVDNMASEVEDTIVHLGLYEQQEQALESIMVSGIQETNKVFNRGLKLDENFSELINQMAKVYDSTNELSHSDIIRILKKLS